MTRAQSVPKPSGRRVAETSAPEELLRRTSSSASIYIEPGATERWIGAAPERSDDGIDAAGNSICGGVG